MADIYEQHRKAFANVSAYIVLKDGERVASVTFKFGARVACYFHIIGSQMAKGWAGGGGYDRTSASAYVAVRAIDRNAFPEHMALIDAMREAITDTGRSWDRDLAEAGFVVCQAV